MERLWQGGRQLRARVAPGDLGGVHPRLQPAPHREAEGGHLHQSQADLPLQWAEQISRPTNSSFSKAAPQALVVGKENEAKSSLPFTASQMAQKSPACGLATSKNMDVARSGNRIPVPESHIKSGTVLGGFQDESPEKPDPTEQGPEDTAAPEAVAENPIGALLSPGRSQCGRGADPG